MKNYLKLLMNKFINMFKSKELYCDIKYTPIDVFFEIQEGNIHKIIKKGNITQFTNTELEDAYYNLMDNYYIHFEKEPQTIEQINLELQLANLICEYLKTNDDMIRLEIDLLKEELNSIKLPNNKNSKKVYLPELLTFLEMNYKFRIDETISTYKFYSYLKNLEKNTKRN